MPKSLPELLLKGFAGFSASAFKALEKALAAPRQAQLRTLHEILQLANTRPEILTYSQFRHLPLLTYDDLEPRIQQALADKAGYLTYRPPFNHEPTSGSSGAKKLIPYTQELIGSFTTLFLCWAHDLLRYGPPLRGGRIYFSVSPQFHETEYGLNDDSDYLSGITGLLFKRFTLVPPSVKKLKHPEDFFRVVSLFLLAGDELEVISIWSPSFLLSFLDYIQSHRNELIADLQQPEITRAGQRFVYGRIAPQKLKALEQADLPLQALFPALKLISCWGANNARAGYLELQRRFDWVLVQEKGLLATEAPLTVPSIKYKAFLPLLTEVFFEFLDEDNRIHLLDELVVGKSYEIVISQKSGLLRYRLKDRVLVTGKVLATPCFGFLERTEEVSDLVGEKLNEHFIAGITQAFYPDVYLCLIPDRRQARYLLFANQTLDPAPLEAALATSPHYANARKLNQIGALELKIVPHLEQRLKTFFIHVRGMNLGDIKDKYLYTREADGALAEFLLAEGG